MAKPNSLIDNRENSDSLSPTNQDLSAEIALHSFGRPWQGAANIDLEELLSRLKRRKWLIIGMVAIATLATAVIIMLLPPRFIAVAKVKVDVHDPRLMEITSTLPNSVNRSADEEAVESEVHAFTSPQLVQRVIDKLRLRQNREFNPELEAKRSSPILEWIQSAQDKLLGHSKSEHPNNEHELNDSTRHRLTLIENLLEKISVSREDSSRIISVSVESLSPLTAARIANTIADDYIQDQLGAKSEAAKRQSSWLQKNLANLRESVQSSENAAEQYRQEVGLLKGKDATLISQQLTELSTELILARTKRAEAEAVLQQIQKSDSIKELESIPDVISNQVIASLRDKENDILNEISAHKTEYGPAYSLGEKLRAKLKSIRKDINTQVKRITISVRNHVKTAQAQEEALESSLKKLEAEAIKLNTHQGKISALEREASANQTLLATVLQQFKQTSALQEFNEPDARVISYAEPPLHPSSPNKILFISLAFFGSLSAALVLVLLLEQLKKGFRNTDQIKQYTGLNNLAVIPAIDVISKGFLRSKKNNASNYPTFIESLRSLYTNLLGTERSKIILFISACPGEGKTTLSVSFARLLADQGLKVILIDGDLRNSTITRTFKLETKPGLADILADNSDIHEALQNDPHTTLQIIGSGATHKNPLKFLDQNKLEFVLSRLSQASDFIIIDSPPILAVSDAQLLCRAVDKTIYVIRWTTPRKEAISGLRQLQDAGVNFAGAVFNAVDMKKFAEYTYSKPSTYNQHIIRYHDT